ncbi:MULTISPECIES: hypothetical protein [unclassified Corynebacterium]|uniref:hypothetical protein n=1 Tax=unclassified Corynebacterium TaxID=2624378 RepID=UPI00216A22CB|nr:MULTISPECIES: hypothetical protein [unclassified Corynebacterium]MCS4490378.1 hypothetical protein [Corynebacterium sp. ES2775-CONJ]MCS4492158.1 hypothetical protein [Corynebacterium sp. ES2715-CONJ3]
MRVLTGATLISWILVAVGMYIRYNFMEPVGAGGMSPAMTVLFFSILGISLVSLVLTATLIVSLWTLWRHPERFKEGNNY